jgi:predicted Rossmann fold nucleotide-binding protein DprA/Smf involved in DNA uptake
MRTALVAALASRLIRDLEPLSKDAYRAIADSGADDPEKWATANLSASDASSVRGRIARIEEVEAEIDKLREGGIHTISEFDDTYPARYHESLREKRPPLLFAAGDFALLSSRSIGIVGSRDVDEEGSTFAADVARVAAREGWTVVSGGARGVDSAAMSAAFEAGGGSIGFLADSLIRAVKSSRANLAAGNVCLATEVVPWAPFTSKIAMSRNKLIYGHSTATLVVAATHGSGGSWWGAVQALSGGFCKVLVRSVDPLPEANRALIQLGGIPLSDPSDLWTAMESVAPGSLF